MGGAELLLFATKGTSIVIMDIGLPTAEERTDRINDEAGGHAIAIGADISCATDVRQWSSGRSTCFSTTPEPS
jgi:hypothetical protein